ncbi:hypothetical protein CDL12_22283 [Handroanthus impetiginosus]|uniref:DUF4408 domain-containing protein n=1 Tax=Handroanthus impetiginosus TaxID=429701 RepID=A0A2G9GIU4_9LAMI|nr:hypothetical protein CDL12_22283 [Handroanthus impetiginosus]
MDMKLKKLAPIAALLILTPLISTSLRFKYLYFIVNIVIIIVGAEAGLLSFFLQSPQNKLIQPPTSANLTSPDDPDCDDKPLKKPVVNFVGKCSSEKISNNFVGVKTHKLKKSSLVPSIFFMDDNETPQEEEEEEEEEEAEAEEEEEEEEEAAAAAAEEEEEAEAAAEEEKEEKEVGELSGQELFQKSETFIGNFYKQLKMQREEPWNKLNLSSQKSF